MASPPETDQDSCPWWLPPVPLDLVSPLEGFSPGPLNLSASLPPEFCPLPFVCFLCGTWHRAFMWKHFQLEEFIIHDCSLCIFPFCGKRGREKWKGETAKRGRTVHLSEFGENFGSGSQPARASNRKGKGDFRHARRGSIPTSPLNACQAGYQLSCRAAVFCDINLG